MKTHKIKSTVASFWSPARTKSNTKVKPISFISAPIHTKFRSSPVKFSSPFSLNPVKKKDLTYPQAKALYPGLNPYGDADKDGVKNWLDCRPFDPKRQDEPKRKITKKEQRKLMKEQERIGEIINIGGRKAEIVDVSSGKIMVKVPRRNINSKPPMLISASELAMLRAGPVSGAKENSKEIFNLAQKILSPSGRDDRIKLDERDTKLHSEMYKNIPIRHDKEHFNQDIKNIFAYTDSKEGLINVPYSDLNVKEINKNVEKQIAKAEKTKEKNQEGTYMFGETEKQRRARVKKIVKQRSNFESFVQNQRRDRFEKETPNEELVTAYYLSKRGYPSDLKESYEKIQRVFPDAYYEDDFEDLFDQGYIVPDKDVVKDVKDVKDQEPSEDIVEDSIEEDDSSDDFL